MRSAWIVVLVGLAACPNSSRNEARTLTDHGNKQLGAKQYDSAIDDYTKAIEKDHDNAYAWYGLGIAYHSGKKDFDKAADAFAKTVELAPEQPMYQMGYGISLYDKTEKTARHDQATRLGKKDEEIDTDLSGVSFEKAQQHLQEAIKLNGDMWRPHYFLGKILRAQEKAKDAAEEFTKAISTNPREPGPYVALGELYRKWDFTDQAIQVTKQGTLNVPGSIESAEIFYVLGMGYDDKRMEKEAIDAFTKAIEAQKDHHKAKFQRGQAYFRSGDITNAKRDLEEFSKSGGASLDFVKQQASKMLMDIAAKAAGAANKDKDKETKKSPEEAVKGGKGGKGAKGAGYKPPKH
jgi:tetratricopeptide (TPR) repeat protein